MSEAEEQTARAILVVRIVFNDFALCYRFTGLLHTDMTDDTLVNRVLGKLKLPVTYLRTDAFEDRHSRVIVYG